MGNNFGGDMSDVFYSVVESNFEVGFLEVGIRISFRGNRTSTLVAEAGMACFGWERGFLKVFNTNVTEDSKIGTISERGDRKWG